MAAIVADRPAFLKSFMDDFYNVDELRGTRVSDQAWQMSWNLGVTASAIGTLACVPAWLTDFRGDLPRIDVPTLVVQGIEDRILPIDATGRRLPKLIKDVRLVEIPGGPHNIAWTHPDEVNGALMDFLKWGPGLFGSQRDRGLRVRRDPTGDERDGVGDEQSGGNGEHQRGDW